jgi:alpha-ketoglutarate-dependent taurine dioxygenase
MTITFNEIQAINNISYSHNDALSLQTSDISNFRLSFFDDFLERENIEKILSVFRQDKFVILSRNDIFFTAKDLLQLEFFLGKIKVPTRGKTFNGLFPIEVPKSESVGISAKNNLAQPLHTDDGFRDDPPMILAMLCEFQSQNGGYSKLVRGLDVISFLCEQHIELIEDALQNQLLIHTTHDGKNHKSRTLYELSFNTQNIGISWSPFARIVRGSSNGEQLYRIINKFCQSPENQITFKLNPGEILVIDNTSMFHGRSEFCKYQKRRLIRAWYDGFSGFDLNLGLPKPQNLKLNDVCQPLLTPHQNLLSSIEFAVRFDSNT